MAAQNVLAAEHAPNATAAAWMNDTAFHKITSFEMTAEADTKRAVDQYWRTAREVHKLIGCWAFTTVHSNLIRLAAAGVFETKRQKHPNGEVVLYREARQTQDSIG